MTMALSMTMNLFCCMKKLLEESRIAEALDIPGTFFLPPRLNSSRNRRTMSGVKTTDLPLSLLRFNPSFRATSTGAEHDIQRRFGLYLQRTRPQNKPVEPQNSRSC